MIGKPGERDPNSAFLTEGNQDHLTQRKLEFNSSLQEISLRQQLNQAPFPNMALQVPSATPTSHHPLQTPIGQMMAVRLWVTELQKQVRIDEVTGYLLSLKDFLPMVNKEP